MIKEKFFPAANNGQDFDYQQLTPKTREQIQALTSDIRNRLRRCALDIYQIGYDLCLIKQQLQHGQFRAWLKAEFDWSVSAANKFMHVSQRFQPEELETVEISPSALYVLAAPSTPNEVRNHALAQAKQGKTITFSFAKQLIKEDKHSEGDEQIMQTYPIEIQESLQPSANQVLQNGANSLKDNKVSGSSRTQHLETAIYDVSNFTHYLKQEWRKMSLADQNLSVIVCQVVLHNKKWQSMMPQVIQLIINGLAQNLKRTDDFVGLYNHEQCVAVLPHTDSEGVEYVAERMRKWLKTWKNDMGQGSELNEISVLLGVATAIPRQDSSFHLLIRKAQSSLSELE